jgi:hypothetical protein
MNYYGNLRTPLLILTETNYLTENGTFVEMFQSMSLRLPAPSVKSIDPGRVLPEQVPGPVLLE